MEHSFKGQWITDSEFYDLEPRNVFHRQLDKVDLPCANHRNRHILFRKKFNLERCGDHAEIFISADDYYKLYINGIFAGQGPAPSYHFQYQYNCIDVSRFLKKGENIIAIHTLYQGLINRVWQSGDNRHGLILDLMIKNTVVVSSDESFTTRPHSGYSEMGTCGYETQFLERYDSGAAEIDFSQMDFDDSKWDHAKIRKIVDYTLTGQKSHMLDFETIAPIISKETQDGLFFDFGSNYVGYLHVVAKGESGDLIKVRCAQELNDDGSVRFNLRANCRYEEDWILGRKQIGLVRL